MGRTATLPRPVAHPRKLTATLENGDRLTRVEFERRYQAMPELKKAELIEGVVHLSSPVRFTQHAFPSADLIGWLGVYEANTRGIQVGNNGTVRLDLDNEPQPDAFMRIPAEIGGQSSISEDDYIVGAPELVAEVAASTVSIELHDKMNAYRRNAVQEYIVWRVLDEEFDWFVWREERYDRLAPDDAGVYRSEQFPGLWLDSRALLSGDVAKVLAVLQKGIESPEHRSFLEHLSSVG